MNYKIPADIPVTCDECEHFQKKGIIDRFKGFCSFYGIPTYSTSQCNAIYLSEQGKIPKELVPEQKKRCPEAKLMSGLITINVIFIFFILYSILIYTSLMSDKLPWYEPCGEQFLVILYICCPIFLILGVIQLIMIKGKSMNISNTLKCLPFLACIYMALPVLLDLRLGQMEILGTGVSIVILIFTILFTAIDVKKIKRQTKH